MIAGDDYLPDLEPVDGGGTMQVVRSSATVGDTNAEALYYLAISSARESIELTAAYFVPRPAFTDALCTAAKRGVDVRILVPGPHIDKGFVRLGGRAAYDELLDAGARLFEYQPTMLHAKTLCVDGVWSSVGTVNFDNRSFQLHDEITLCVWDRALRAGARIGVRGRPLAVRRDRRRAVEPAAASPARRRGRDDDPAPRALNRGPILLRPMLRRSKPSRWDRARGLLPGRRVARRNPVMAALGDADQAVLRFLRTRGHAEPVETVAKALGHAGEFGAIWAGIGAVGASVDERRRGQWLLAGLTGPAAIGVNFIAKVAIGRQRPLIEDHPALAKAPTKLSFPSAHATSSAAAAAALGRVQPRARPYLFALAAAICVGRPYLGMHYPSDVIAGVALGTLLGSVVPGLGEPHTEDRLFELAVDANAADQASRRAAGNGGAPAPAAA